MREFLSATIIPLAMEMPTRDIINIMKSEKLPADLQEIITSILRNTDRAKYAKQIFAQERINEVVEDSFKLVRLIKRKSEEVHAQKRPIQTTSLTHLQYSCILWLLWGLNSMKTVNKSSHRTAMQK